MKIAIIGAGNIGSSLGQKWAGAGHSIWFGVRNPNDVKFDDLRPLGSVSSVSDALGHGQIILLSLPSSALAEFASLYGETLAGKIVIDATNDFRNTDMSGLSVLKEKAPGAQLVRAFSSLGWENFANPRIGNEIIDLFYCAEDKARSTADQLITEVGLRPVYLGGLEAAGAVDGMTRVWFALAFGQGRGRRIAFKLLG